MNTTSTSAARMTARRTGVAFVLIAGLVLAGCQAALSAPSRTPRPAAAFQYAPAAPYAPAGVDTSRPADRVAEGIERNADRMAELSKRFAGVPADRIEEQLQREAATGGASR